MKTGFRLIGAFAFSAFVLLSNLPGNARAQDIATLQLRAEKGDAQSQSQLGYRYSAGEGVTQDFQKAVFWYRKAAEQGRPVAQYNLGNKYRYGEGVPKDFKQARFWFDKAAAQGSPDAMFAIGAMYDEGEGVTQDNKQSLACTARLRIGAKPTHSSIWRSRTTRQRVFLETTGWPISGPCWPLRRIFPTPNKPALSLGFH